MLGVGLGKFRKVRIKKFGNSELDILPPTPQPWQTVCTMLTTL